MSKLEIWGWDGSTQEFATIYKNKTGTDLNYGYCCEEKLRKMGYPYAVSLIFVGNYDDYLAGKINWDTTQRVVIIRQISKNKYIDITTDSLWQESVGGLIYDVEAKDSSLINQFLVENPSKLNDVLTGTLAVNKNCDLRVSCCDLLYQKINFSVLKLSNTELKILSSMLSFPDPQTCYCAMKIISQSNIKNKNILFNDKAETLKDFLKSNLQTYKKDAMSFLSKIEPKGKEWSNEDWIKWINKY